MNDNLKPENKPVHHRKFSYRSFFWGIVIGLALLPGGYFTYLLITEKTDIIHFGRNHDDNQSDSTSVSKAPLQLAGTSADTIPTVIDSMYYWQKWDQLTAMSGYRDMDSLFLDSVIRKMYVDSLSTLRNIAENPDVVQNERMIAKKSMPVVIQKTATGADSTRKDAYHYSSANYKIEFWQSPLNFRGFKRAENFVVLYGLLPKNTTGFVQLDDAFYIRENQIWYSIPETSDFAELQPVTAPQLLQRINVAIKHK